ncbi:hypothetical protein [Bifidobacterium olomucense]|uniref:Uncharacterized protein n=1 Tax=Bifidobacterium olomucense TaxID=2675324 RepID=A0A7Y0EZT3_9BIFI|nr:hypothetical protein [Bifidobacterium sp. DSM 109959]NMM99387.1 hypothetical protein [Bifidobacterium sp. DSM 109959]
MNTGCVNYATNPRWGGNGYQGSPTVNVTVPKGVMLMVAVQVIVPAGVTPNVRLNFTGDLESVWYGAPYGAGYSAQRMQSMTTGTTLTIQFLNVDNGIRIDRLLVCTQDDWEQAKRITGDDAPYWDGTTMPLK